MATKKKVEEPKPYEFSLHAIKARMQTYNNREDIRSTRIRSELSNCEAWINTYIGKGQYKVTVYIYDDVAKPVVAKLRGMGYRVKGPSLYIRVIKRLFWAPEDEYKANTAHTISWDFL